MSRSNAAEATTASISHNPAQNSPSDTIGGVPIQQLDGLTIYEKKCVLINHELDANGMGRYQWAIWSLCGFGYMLDLLWAQAFGLVLSPLQQELGFPGDQSGNISVAFSAGLTAGAAFWGILVDIIGRRWAFNLTCLISAAFGLGLGGCNSYNAFLVVTAFVGFGIGGNVPIDTTICLEFIPQDRRFLLTLLSIFQPIGVVVTCALAYAYIPPFSCSPNFSQEHPLPSCRGLGDGTSQPCCTRQSNMGWRYLMFTIGAVTMAVFCLRFFVFRFRESPKFLVYRGRDDAAIRVLEHVAKTNKRVCGVSRADFDALTAEHDSVASSAELLGSGKQQRQLRAPALLKLELARYRLLFDDWTMVRLTVLVWLTYVCDFWGFTLAGTYLPTILAIKNGAIHLSLAFTYRSYIAIYAPGIVGVLVGGVLYRVRRLGRKLALLVSSALMGVSILLLSVVNDQASNIGLGTTEYFFQSMFNAVLYGLTPELFAAPVRGTASGLASFWGRLFGIIAPLTAQTLVPTAAFHGDPAALNSVLYLAGGITLGCVLWTALLPARQLGKQSF